MGVKSGKEITFDEAQLCERLIVELTRLAVNSQKEPLPDQFFEFVRSAKDSFLDIEKPGSVQDNVPVSNTPLNAAEEMNKAKKRYIGIMRLNDDNLLKYVAGIMDVLSAKVQPEMMKEIIRLNKLHERDITKIAIDLYDGEEKVIGCFRYNDEEIIAIRQQHEQNGVERFREAAAAAVVADGGAIS